MYDSNLKVSVVMAAFRRARLLDLGLFSMSAYNVKFPLEIVVVNDGIEDDTEAVCDSYKEKLDIKYIFSGYRNKYGIKSQSPGFPLNVGIKQSVGSIIVLTCPEIYHLDDCLNKIVGPLMDNNKYLVVPNFMYFDDGGTYTNEITNGRRGDLKTCNTRYDSIEMPFLMGLYKDEITKIGGYDEDFTGYATEDNDLIDRLKLNGCNHFKVDTNIVHLHHGIRSDSGIHWDEPRWAQNRKIYEDRKGQIIRNAGRNWGQVKMPNNIIEKDIEITDWLGLHTSSFNSTVVIVSGTSWLTENINKNISSILGINSGKQFFDEIQVNKYFSIPGDLMDYKQLLKKIKPGAAPNTALLIDIPENVDKEKSLNVINALKKDFKKILLLLSAGVEDNKDREVSGSSSINNTDIMTWNMEDILKLNFDEVIAVLKTDTGNKQKYKTTIGRKFYLCTWNKYKLSRIPKKLHLYWDRTSKMSKLQMFTIDSFLRLNPDWQIYIYRPIQDYMGSKSYIPDYSGKDYFFTIENKKNANIVNVDLRDFGINLDMHNILRSDILRYHLLYNYGGVWSDFDVIWLKPMDYFHNIEYIGGSTTPDSIGSAVSMTNTTTGKHNISVMMSSKNNEFIKSLIDKSNEIQNSSMELTHQVFGSDMLDGLYPKLSDITIQFPDVVGLNYETFFPYSIFNMGDLYERNNLHHINNNVMCIHWFNGHILSKNYVNENGYEKDCSMTSILKKEGYL